MTATRPHPIFLAGRWVESPDVLIVENPADPTNPAGSTFNATPEQYEEAVEAAVAAFEITRTLPAYERGRILREISAGVTARREELARLIALEIGKPSRDALIEADRAAFAFRLGAEEAERMVGEVIPLDLLAVVEGPRRDHAPVPDRADRRRSARSTCRSGLSVHKLAPAIARADPSSSSHRAAAPLTMPRHGRDHPEAAGRRQARSASCR